MAMANMVLTSNITNFWTAPVIAGKRRQQRSRKIQREPSRIKTEEAPPSLNQSNLQSLEAEKPAVKQAAIPSRGQVFRACLVPSGGILLGGLVLRQGSQFLANMGYSFPDCATLLPYYFQPWHLAPTLGLVATITAGRVALLNIWPDFAQSSETTNKLLLLPLGPWDCFTISFASGISEELLFRGALLPLIGLDYKGVLISGLVFGVLHVTGGRNVAFAIWASVLGILYGAAAIWTTDLFVPMLAHSSANLVSALLWKYNTGFMDRKSTEL